MLPRMIGVKRKMMSGKMNNLFQDLFVSQAINQDRLLKKGVYDRYKDEHTVTVPVDDVGLASYHIQQLISEIGEVLEADKRWKSHRNDKYNRGQKLEEIADCFIVLMNIAMFSGFCGAELEMAIVEKLHEVSERIESKQ